MSNPLRAAVLALVIGVLASVPGPVFAQGVPVAQEDFFVKSFDPGVQLYLRNKYPEGQKHFGIDRIVLFVHGATYPSESTFDLQLDGKSWMDSLAQQGYDVYALDVRGYGASTRPPAMSEAPAANPPIVHTATAVNDVSAAVEFILKRRSVIQLSLIGWSWGTTIMAAYTAQNNEKVYRLVLYAPLWLRQTPSSIGGDAPLGAYRAVTMEMAKQRWMTDVPAGRQAELLPPVWFTAFSVMTLATDPVGAKQTPPVIRAPNGVLADLRAFWAAGKPYYDPAAIKVPVLLIHGEWDVDTPAYMSQALFPKLTQAPFKRYVVVGEGTHSLMIERNRGQLFREVQLFLGETRD